MKRLTFITYFVLLILISPIIGYAADEPTTAEEMYYLDQIKEEPQNLDPYLGLAKWYTRFGQFDKAVNILSQATSIAPNNPALYAAFGDAYGSKQKLAQAAEMYNLAVKLEPENAGYWYALGTLEHRLGKNPDALSAYLKAEPNFARGGIELGKFYAELAELYVIVGKANEAEKLIDKLAKQEPKSAATLAAIGDVYTALRQYDKSVSYYEQAFDLNPSDTQLMYRIINSYRNSGRIKELVEFAKKAISKTTNPAQAVQVWNQTANAFYQGGSTTDLLDLYDSVCKVVTDKSSRRNIRVSLFNYFQNRVNELTPIFEMRYKKSPKDADVIAMLAEIYDRTNQTDKAIAFYEKQHEIQPEDTRNLDSLAMLYQKKGDIEKAVALRQNALAKNPDSPENYANLARLYNQTGKKGQADELIIKLKEKFPNNPAALQALISLYRELGQPDNVIAAMKELIAISPDNTNNQQMLVRFYLDSSRFSEAEKELEPMLASITTGAQEYQIRLIYELAFSLYAKTNRIEKSLALYQTAEELVSEKWAQNNLRWSVINSCQQSNRLNRLINVLKEKLKEQPDNLSILALLARAYEQSNRYPESLPIYEQLYASDSDNEEYVNQLVNLYQNTQNWQKVIEINKKLIARYPDQTRRYNNLVQAYTQLGKPELVEKIITELKNRSGDTPQLWTNLAQIYEAMHKPQEAITYYEKATAANPANIQYYSSLGRLYQQIGNDSAALKAYLKVKELGARDWERSQTEKALVTLYLQAGNWKMALKEFDFWVSVTRNQDWQMSEALRQLLPKLIQQNQVITAWELVKKYSSTQRRPSGNDWEISSYDYQFTEFLRQSLALQTYLEKEVEKGTKDKSIYASLVYIYRDTNRGEAQPARAIPVLEKAIKQFPNEPEPYVYLAQIYAQQQKNGLAITAYQTALSIQTAKGMTAVLPTSSQFNTYATMQQLASRYLKLNQKEKAIALAKELEKLPNLTSDIWKTIASVYEEAKEYDNAIPAYQKAVELKPNDPQLRTALIKCYLLIKKYPEAEQEANKLTEISSEPWALHEAYRQLAQIYDKQELYEKEIEIYLKILEVNPQQYSSGNISNELIYWNQNQARYEGLATALEKRVKENPKDLNTLTILGDVYRRLGKPAVVPE